MARGDFLGVAMTGSERDWPAMLTPALKPIARARSLAPVKRGSNTTMRMPRITSTAIRRSIPSPCREPTSTREVLQEARLRPVDPQEACLR